MRESITQAFVLLDAEMRYKARQKETDPIPRAWDYYPKLFAAEKEKYDAEQDGRSAAELAEGRRTYAAEFNRRRNMG